MDCNSGRSTTRKSRNNDQNKIESYDPHSINTLHTRPKKKKIKKEMQACSSPWLRALLKKKPQKSIEIKMTDNFPPPKYLLIPYHTSTLKSEPNSAVAHTPKQNMNVPILHMNH